jgi:thymidylate synthase (FAD)
MKVELKTEYSTPDADSVPIMAARGDYMSESLVGLNPNDDEVLGGISPSKDLNDPTTEDLKCDFIGRLIRRGHFGPFEHYRAMFAVKDVSQVPMTQITRHRHMSFEIQSMRYVDFSEVEPVVPSGFEPEYIGGVRADAVLRERFERQNPLATPSLSVRIESVR